MSDRDQGPKSDTHGTRKWEPPHEFSSFTIHGDKVMFAELLITYRAWENIRKCSQDNYVEL